MVTQPAVGPSRVRAVIALAAAGLAGCAGRPATPTTPVPAGESPGIAVPVSARRFDIDPAASEVMLLVRRAGPLARFGHNHAIVSGEERGVVWLGASVADSGFEIHLPVRSLVVDDPAARAAAGADFPGTVPDDARAGTTTNMLRTEVLDAEHFPEIVVRADHAAGSWQQPVVHATVRLKDVPREFDVPVVLEQTSDRIVATGSFQIRQSDFGITPFSVAGGAVQVADAVDIRFRLVANK